MSLTSVESSIAIQKRDSYLLPESKSISCASYHNPALDWSGGLPKAIGNGMKETRSATPTILNAGVMATKMLSAILLKAVLV